jgi:hypothetical protein
MKSAGNRLLVSDTNPVTLNDVPLLDLDAIDTADRCRCARWHGEPLPTIVLRGGYRSEIQRQNGLLNKLLPDDYLVPSLGINGLGKLLLVSVTGSTRAEGCWASCLRSTPRERSRVL